MRYSVIELEERYRRLQALGSAVDHAGASFEHFDLRPYLEQVLSTLSFGPAPTALEYGTGTGPGACFLAARGFQVEAIDIAPTAIAMARQFAAERGLTIRFVVQDICDLPIAEACYDLVVDNFCLQRLVTDDRRSRALRTVRAVLKPAGAFVIGTTIFREDRELSDDELCDPETGIVYRRLPPGTRPCDDLIFKDGALVYPRVRRVRPEFLQAELGRAGFRVDQHDGGRVLCRIA